MASLDVLAACAASPGISLAEVDRLASLQTRVDRKYALTPAEAAVLIPVLATRSAVTTVTTPTGDLRASRYRSTYFDTPDLESYRRTATKRRHRFKVRTRTYVDSSASFLEVKIRGTRGVTEKIRTALPDGMSATALDRAGRSFIDDVLDRTDLGASLAAVVTTEYLRTTLVDLDSTTRATIDTSLAFVPTGDGATSDVSEAVGLVIVETKSAGGVSWYDRVLWDAGIRPSPVSKFGVGMAVTRPELPSNRWHRILRDHLAAR